jgi:hypothetical protein
MKDNVFAYWDYDSIECKPRRELTTFGATVVTIGGMFVVCAAIYAIPFLFSFL